MFFRNIYLAFYLFFRLSLAALISVSMDNTVPTHPDGNPKIYLWSSIATFNSDLSDGQIVAIAEDGYKSMLQGAFANNYEEQMPFVMTALAHKVENGPTTVYLASSAKGSGSLVYKVTKYMNKPCNGAVWGRVPNSLKNALDTCKNDLSTSAKQHQFDAKCGEMNALLEVYASTQIDPRSMGGHFRIVTWQGRYTDTGIYRGGRIKAPCWKDDGIGCSDTLEALTFDMDVIKTQRESYANNMPVSVTSQGIFRSEVSRAQSRG
ncbi:uncharacterized protein N7484_000243 [Penicillium longicatenatum]|uniref:uncharacterized protein n=1 Tax=Penicillium longicatenatum TaxID=1561947 RepID=UPI002548A96D|nr:uncharacterized protein N7484_000243 [Penicillium longicatenatum]KAJ5660871.1 hypothetical protein N7484_000243 [Penicillium longicatenatum]